LSDSAAVIPLIARRLSEIPERTTPVPRKQQMIGPHALLAPTGDRRSLLLFTVGGAVFGAGLVAPGGLAAVATTLIVVGAGQMSVGLLLPRLTEFEIGPGGVKTKMDTETTRPRMLFEAEANRLNRFAYLMCGDRAQAREIVELALRRVNGRQRRIPSDQRGVITLRTLIELLDTASERRWLRGIVAGPSDPQGDQTPADAIVDALSRLDLETRAAFVLRVDWPLPPEEVALLMGRPEADIRRDIDVARSVLRPYIGETHAS
jgi:DNA-directed RNA polymerase specialized sigma24 family protein